MKPERLQKLLAQAGLGSRRQMERWIADGRVTVNGSVATLGSCANTTDNICVDGRLLRLSSPLPDDTQIIIYYKPEGEVCTQQDPQQRVSVFHALPRLRTGRWVMVGRLDINTSGLLLFTNNGELANRLMHPRYQVEREYAVRILGSVSQEAIQRLLSGVLLEDGMAKFDNIRMAGGEGANRWYHVVLREGRHREVRRLWESQGVQVSRLIRIRFGSVTLPEWLSRGKWHRLTRQQVLKVFAEFS